ncbi:MAG: ThuA domain-containing protein, partial [Saprospiraceae bacterium]|nr:ThuA domain-containing protein [Saprospiraceae bacterium]
MLIFNKTEFVFHESTQAGSEALEKLCKEQGYAVEITDDAEVFTAENLRKVIAVVFLNTAGDVLNPSQEKELERYIQAGGGFVGIHTAIDTEHNWSWYGQLVGGHFDSQVPEQTGVLQIEQADDPATKHLNERWQLHDEWFNLRNVSPEVNVLLSLNESSIQGGNMGTFHPIAWRQEFDGGRSFFTALGHNPELYRQDDFLQLLLGGLQYAIGDGKGPDYSRLATPKAAPKAGGGSGFVKTSLACNLYEPMGFDQLPDGKIVFIERRGSVKLLDPANGSIRTLAEIPVYIQNEEGLLGLALDPNWADNHWLYLYYAPENGVEAIRLARFKLKNEQLELGSEQVLLEIPTDRSVHNYHAGGCLEFDDQGYLYLATGDNTDHYDDGYTSIDERPGKSQYDSQKSASNSMDLRGKILKIKPLPDGTYLCPADNLFTGKEIRVGPGGYRLLHDPFWSQMIGIPAAAPYPASISARYAQGIATGMGRPEIFVMGCRNPFRIFYDRRRQLLIWGEPGPDAGVPDSLHGPEGYDEINIARTAGFYGWPYFVANNKPYRDFDYASESAGAWFDPARPINNSPHNTGARQLPAARSALIWYPFKSTAEFPLVANGTRCAMAGPAYYCDQYPEESRFPEQYDGKIIIYDWMRHWMLAIDIDSLDQLAGMQPIGGTVRLSRPIDMLIDKNGALWVLEYGTEWYS